MAIHHHIDITIATGGRDIELDETRKGRERDTQKKKKKGGEDIWVLKLRKGG